MKIWICFRLEGVDEETIVLTNVPYGEIVSGNFPSTYANSQDQSFLITVPDGMIVALNFTYLNVSKV